MTRALRIAFIVGEPSGDALGADLLEALRRGAGPDEIEAVGLAGERLRALGVRSLFDISDVAVMGISAVVGRLPKIARRIRQTARAIVALRPDCVVAIDSPDFTHAVAKRVRARLPGVPIVKYVCPSVWAWRPGRAPRMRAHIDHVLAILPFEPAVLQQLGGPECTYVGHPLVGQVETARAQAMKPVGGPPRLLVLPGSRLGEINRMLAIYGETLNVLRERGHVFEPVVPAVAHLRREIERRVASWPQVPTIVDAAENGTTFRTARAALATSGTVALELALHRVPTAIAYRFDALAKRVAPFVDVWTASLPNLIADELLLPEDLDETVRPARLARRLELLLTDGHERTRQLEGFERVAERMRTDRPPGEVAAGVVLSMARQARQTKSG